MGFFSKPEIRQFNYTPRYWDPRKEAMEERRARIRKQLQSEQRRANNDDDDSRSEGTHRTTLQHGFLREQRGRAGVADENKLMKVVVISAAVLIVYLALKYFGI